MLQLPGVKIVAEIHIWPHRLRNAYFREGINYELAPLDAFARPGLSGSLMADQHIAPFGRTGGEPTSRTERRVREPLFDRELHPDLCDIHLLLGKCHSKLISTKLFHKSPSHERDRQW